jgi:hypothetical protein
MFGSIKYGTAYPHLRSDVEEWNSRKLKLQEGEKLIDVGLVVNLG